MNSDKYRSSLQHADLYFLAALTLLFEHFGTFQAFHAFHTNTVSRRLFPCRASVISLVRGTPISWYSVCKFCSFSLKYLSLSLELDFFGPWPFLSDILTLFTLSFGCSSVGPRRQRTAGRSTKPWKSPKIQIMKKILKKETKTCDLEVTSSDNANSDEKPPGSRKM